MEILASFCGKEPNTVVLVDLSWVLHKNFNAIKVSSKVDGVEVPTGHLFGATRLVQSLMTRRDWAVVFCVDNLPKRKLDIDPEYKAGRPKTFNLRQTSDELVALVTSMQGVYAAYSDDEEADDVMYTLAKRLQDRHEIIIYSGDNDLLPAVNDRCRIVRKLTKDKIEYLEEEYVIDKYNVGFNKISFYKVLTGDDADNVTPIPGMTPSKAVEIINKFTNLDVFLTKEWKNQDLKDKAFQNYELTRLREVEIKFQKHSLEEALVLADKYRLRGHASILTALRIKSGMTKM